MASVYYLTKDAYDIKQDIVQKYIENQDTSKLLYFSAVKIQSLWRGYVVRKMIEHWNKTANTIQRYVRGWLIRWNLPKILHKYHLKLCEKAYHIKATQIQAFFRGYLVRREVDIKAILAKRLELERIARQMREQMEAMLKQMQEEQKLVQQKMTRRKVLEALFDRHHLLRTRHREGVLSIHGSEELSELEKILRNMPLRKYMDELNKTIRPAQEPQLELNAHTRFNLNTKLEPKPYERMMLTRNSIN